MEEEEWKRGRGEDGRKSLEKCLRKKKTFKNCTTHPLFFLLIGTGWTLLLPSAGIGGGATGVGLGSDSNQILKLS